MLAVNMAAPVVATHTIQIAAPALTVWNLVATIAQWETWNPKTRNVTCSCVGPCQIGSAFSWQSEGIGIEATIHAATPPHTLIWAAKAMGVDAVHHWTFEETEEGTLVQTAQSMEGITANLLRGQLQPALEANLSAWLLALKNRAEK